MQANSKTFRLFISSTFSDFQNERELLQTRVFPHIKEYCSKHGYTFQPIDLRWGVSNEAQLDHKGLDMCLEEVQSCKTHDYPNFLIMLGDRYGWVPIPNLIKKDEFELLLHNLDNKNDKELLSSWYFEDENQLPVSYVLKKREDKYIDYDLWLEVEDELRDILQSAINDLKLNDNAISKYFTSATEAEAIEGIISYCQKTDSQKEQLKYIPNLEHIDAQHIFGFLRNVDSSTTVNDKYISNDYDKAQEFKQRIKNILPEHNILDINTSQETPDSLEETYLMEFESSITSFLKNLVDKQISKDKQLNYSDLEIEKSQQNLYLNQKVENFLGQDKILNDIQKYISDDNDKPLIVCGKSGIGKSSVLAKAIEDASNHTSKKIIYRFVGATPNSTTTKDILISILEELNITIEDKLRENEKKSYSLEEENNFSNVVDTFHNHIVEIKEEEVVIFIDAVDQLINDDQLLWLPNKLPSNIKIVISALKDREYEDDSKYFYRLEDKITHYIEIEPFNKPIELLELLLSYQNRTLQENQKHYFLEQYNKVNTPLYVFMAANQIQFWKSSEIVNTEVILSVTQKGIVEDFITNLTSIHHHNKLFVQKVLGYIIASKDGLSEYEILQLISTDKNFIDQIAPNTWHKNITQELPLVIWARLYRHIKPFLSRKNQNGQELLYFFHREFIGVIKNQGNQKEEQESALKAIQKLIKTNKDKEFDSNRWGKLYVLLLIEYYLEYNNQEKIIEYYNNILQFLNPNIILEYLKYIEIKRDEFRVDENNIGMEHLIEIIIYISNRYKSVSNDFYMQYVRNLHYQATTLIQEKDYFNAIEIEKKNIRDIEVLPIFEKIKDFSSLKNIDYTKENLDIELKWLMIYLEIKQFIGFAYLNNKDKAISLKVNEDNYLLNKRLYENSPNNKPLEVIYYNQINYYAMALQQNGVFYQAMNLLQDSLTVLEKKHNEDSIYLYDPYAKLLYVLSAIVYSIKKFNDSQKYFFKAYDIYEKLIKYDYNKYSKIIISLNENLIENYNSNNVFLKSEHFYKYNIKLLNKRGKKGVKETIQKISDDLFIKVFGLKKKKQQLELFFVNKRLIEYVFNFDKDYWAKFYVQKLVAFSSLLSQSKIDDDQLSIAQKLQKEGVDICEQYMYEEDEWNDLYTINMNNLANTYTYLNEKDESYLLNQKNLNVSNKLFQQDPQKWFRAYYYALENMASTYFYTNDTEKEKECRDKIEELESNSLFQLEEEVIQNKATNTKIKYLDYIFKGFLLLGVYFIIKYVIIE